MGHSYSNCLIHLIFSTKGRTKTITPELQEKLWPVIGGIARSKQMKALAVGGVDDHVHVLLSIPSTVSVAQAAREIKALSSKWVHETFPGKREFAWQQGYGAFSIGISNISRTVNYIEGQHEHHHKKTFQEEFIAFLKAHGIKYDERYVWG